MASQFQQPGIANPDDKFTPSESLGALLLFFPTQIQTQVKTAHGEADAVAAKVVRLNDGRVWENALIFPQALVTQLRGAVPDGMVLGTLSQGENKKGNPPWLLMPFTAQDEALADAWIAANPVQKFQQPQTSGGTPAWGGQATPAAPAWGGQASAQAAPANPPAAPGQWGQSAAPAAPAPASSPGAGWGATPAATPAPAPSVPDGVPPHIAAQFAERGVNLAGMSLEQIQGMASMLGIQ